MQIKQMLTKVNFTKVSKPRDIKYIVIHYTANKNDKAVNNAKYFYDVNRNSSAHYFVDENEIYQVVSDNDISWHSGKDYSNCKAPLWNICTNDNSIGIELCTNYNTDYYFSEQTKANAIELVKSLMSKYNIPIDNVVRHFDVTYKQCPAPFVKDYDAWLDFKSKLVDNEIYLAIQKLADQNIIDNPEFWKKNFNTTDGLKYLKDLIIKFAKTL